MLAPPDWVSAFRTAIVFFVAVLVYYSAGPWWLVIGILALAFALDFVDGLLARSFDWSTVHGSLLDVVGDRITEIVLWLTFLYLRMVPLWAPIIILSRAVITDAIRAKAAAHGSSVYGMISTKIGAALVKSRWSRGLYGGSKAIFFILLTLWRYGVVQVSYSFVVGYAAYLTVYSLLRGIPVVLDAKRFFEA
ncbi:MAG: CDP-alcohol phosphatidyltransferase family protein [Candidatus Diapherotrites archaeon]|nr:CDP-alcohol phosphatidyltransferase family protein [Candidatus Diapherotrites archaeon]